MDYLEYKNYLCHHGVKGQKWGERRFQNEDGSLTPEGQRRYGTEYENHMNSAQGSRSSSVISTMRQNNVDRRNDRRIYKNQVKEAKQNGTWKGDNKQLIKDNYQIQKVGTGASNALRNSKISTKSILASGLGSLTMLGGGGAMVVGATKNALTNGINKRNAALAVLGGLTMLGGGILGDASVYGAEAKFQGKQGREYSVGQYAVNTSRR